MKLSNKSRSLLAAACAAGALATAGGAQAQDVKIGFILPMTGQQQSTGKQEAAAAKLWMAQHGDTVAGKKIELIIRDDGAVPDNTKRIAQELIVNDKVDVPRRLRHHAVGARGRSARDRSQDAGDRHRGGHLDHHREVALYRAHQLHAGAVDRADGRLGGAERHQESREYGVRLCARRRCGEILRRGIHRKGRAGRRLHHASRSPIPISRRSCNAPPMPSPTRSSCSCRPARAAPSSSSSSSAASTRPASRSSALAT